jgi:hypothetical protein
MAVPCRYPRNLGYLDNNLLEMISLDLSLLGVPQKQASSDRLTGIRIARLIGIVMNRFTNGNIASEQNLLLMELLAQCPDLKLKSKLRALPLRAPMSWVSVVARLNNACSRLVVLELCAGPLITERLIPAGASSRLTDCPSAQ